MHIVYGQRSVCAEKVYVIERTRGAVGYGGKPKFPHECAARVGNRGWSPINHRSRVVRSDLEHGQLPSDNLRPRER